MNTSMSRRQFLTATLTTGFALAVHPIQAETVLHTDTSDIVADWVSVPSQGGILPAYMAHPDHGEAWPVMVVVQEIFGVHAHIQDVCRRFAKLGYLAIAPELFFRQGDVSHYKEISDILANVVSKVPDKQVMADIDATLAWVKESTHANASKTAISGFCWGGRIVWLYAVHNPHIKTGVAWYGRLAGTPTELQPFYPLDVANYLKVPVLGLYGGQDQGIPVATVNTMLFALNAGTSQSSIHIYPDASHAFFADYRSSYRQDAAEDSWRRMQVWLKNHDMGV